MAPWKASLLTAGVGVGVPLAIQGAGALYDQFASFDERDLGRFNLEDQALAEQELELEEDEALAEQLRILSQSSGKAIGAQIAQSMGTGLTGMSPVSLLQATQGEQMVAGQIGQLQADQAAIEAQRYADKSRAAKENIAGVNAELRGRKRKQALAQMANTAGDASRQFYKMSY
jgi:hypothetical protein